MKKFAAFAVLACALVGTAVGADPVPAAPKIKFPVVASAVTPPPAANPAAPVLLGKGQYYVIASPKPLLILKRGTGDVTVALRKPPFMLPVAQAIGWTPDNPADPEFVHWGPEAPYLYAVKAAKSGDVTLTILPAVTEADEKTKEQVPLTPADVVEKSLLVDDGTTPVVDPKVDPKPKDKDVIPNPSAGFRVLFLYETEAKLTKDQLNTLYSPRIIDYLNAKCTKDAAGRPDWRKWDKGTVSLPDGLAKESAVWRQVWADSKDKLGPLPQLVILTGQTGVTKPWEATEEETLALLKQYGG